MRRILVLATLALAALPAAARAQLQDIGSCTSTGPMQIMALESEITARSVSGGGGGFAYTALVENRRLPRTIWVSFTAPGATDAAQNRQMDAPAGQFRVPLGTLSGARRSLEQLRPYIVINCVVN